MERVIWHWTAGGPGMIPIEADAYHEIVQPNGTWQPGDFPIEANEGPLRRGQYAAHTLNLNTGSIGIACDAMAGAQERPFRWGSNPLTEAQISTMLRRTAAHCRKYGIPVSPTTTLSHAEVQKNLGVRQNNKWDIMVLPGMSGPTDPRKVGDELRSRLRTMMREQDAKAAPKPTPILPRRPMAPNPWQGLFSALRKLFGGWK